ncbi:MAG: ChaN family lipoprotein [Elusimicrobiota bacterium]|nr:ChaN family lipoprotein [Elusimicrobiota bacterium]
MNIFVFILFSAPVLLSAAGAPAAAPVPPAGQTQPATASGLANPRDYCIFGAQSGKPFDSEAAFKSVIWKSDVIYVGETHDRIKDHLAQLGALKAMKIARGSRIAVGFEMMSMTMQPALDDYAAGKLTEEEFLAKADWKNEWSVDFSLYKPLFDFLVQNKLRAIALNVPKRIIAKIARVGLAGLDDEDKKFLPEPVTITKHKKYLEYLKASFDGHGGNPAAAMLTWDNYLASMSAWNEGMGSRVADFINANPGWSVLVVTANGHVSYNAAIPASVKSRTKNIRQASFHTVAAAKCPAVFPKADKDLANYIWYIDHDDKPAKK